MSGSKKPPTALIRRASPDLSDADLAALIVRSRHLFGLKRLDATFEPDGAAVRMRVADELAPPSDVSYLIYSETTQRFIGFRRGAVYHLDGSETSRRMRLVFYPAGRA